MATSGSTSVTVTSWDTLKFSWSRSSYSIADNTSVISWSMQLISGASGYISSSASKSWSVTVNGIKYSGTNTIGIANNATKTLASGSTTIQHNADGTKSFAYSFSQQFDITFSSWIGTKSSSGSGTLDTIPRYSKLTSATDFTDEGNPTLYFTNPSNGYFALRAKIEAGGNNKLIIRDISSTATSYTFSLTEAERKTLRRLATSNTLSVILTICCMNGETELSSSYAYKTMTIVNATPTLNPTVVDQGLVSTTLTGDTSKIIKYFNTCNVAFNAVAKKEATISSMKVTCGSKSRTSDGLLEYVDSDTFIFTVKDSRGNTATQTITKDIIDYTPLTCSLYTDSNIIDDNAAYINLTVKGIYFNGSFGAITNSLAVEYRYKTNNGDYPTDNDGNEIWIDITDQAAISNGKYASQVTISDLDYTNSYTFQARAKDVVYTSWVSTIEQAVKITPIFDWGKNDFNFNVPVTGKEGFISSLSSNNSYVSNNDSDETALNEWLDEQLDSMPDYSKKDVFIECYPALDGSKYAATLYKHTSAYAALDGFSYTNDTLHKNKNNGTWTSANCGAKILWENEWHMNNKQTAYLSESISKQRHGIVLLICEYAYNSEATPKSNATYHFVPKEAIFDQGDGNGHIFSAVGPWYNYFKYLYIHDNYIVGHEENSLTVTIDGITYHNNYTVLRRVYGV